MKALSIRQPWAWAILHAEKRIENRDWKGPPSYRGPLLIHAAKGIRVGEHAEAIAWMKEKGMLGGLRIPAFREHVCGGIVGVCDLVDAVRHAHNNHLLTAYRRDLPSRCLRCNAASLDLPCSKPDPWAVGPICLVLDNVRPLPFVPFAGALGFFDVPDLLVPGAMP